MELIRIYSGSGYFISETPFSRSCDLGILIDSERAKSVGKEATFINICSSNRILKYYRVLIPKAFGMLAFAFSPLYHI